MIVGIAGAYCSGKNTISRFFAEEKFHVVDVDQIGHEVLDENRERIIQAFGTNVLSSGGGIDRRVLGEIVFRSPKMMDELERIVHPGMADRVREIVKKRKERVVINAAVLFKMGLHTICDIVICVHAPILTRLKRAKSRDSLNIWQGLQRIRAQHGICPKTNTGNVDIYFVRNSGNREQRESKSEDTVFFRR
jgi:dephospho-CoA kinase